MEKIEKLTIRIKRSSEGGYLVDILALGLARTVLIWTDEIQIINERLEPADAD